MIWALVVIAILPLAEQDSSQRLIRKVERETETLLEAEQYQVVARAGTRSLYKGLERLLEQEIDESWRDYFELRFEEAATRLQGRQDSEALALRALLAHALGARSETQQLLIRLRLSFPRYHPDPARYPPSFQRLWAEVVRKGSGGGSRLTRLGPLVLDPSEMEASRKRILRICQETGSEEALILHLKTVGWRQRLEGWRLRPERALLSSAVDLEDTARLPEAVEILLKKLKLVDTPMPLFYK